MATMINGLVMRGRLNAKAPEVDKRIIRVGNMQETVFTDSWTVTPTRYRMYLAPIANTVLSWILKGTARLMNSTDAQTAVPMVFLYWVLAIERQGAPGTFAPPTANSIGSLYVPEQNVIAHGNGMLTKDTNALTASTYRCCNWSAESASRFKLQENDVLVLIGYASGVPANVEVAFEFILEAYFSN